MRNRTYTRLLSGLALVVFTVSAGACSHDPDGQGGTVLIGADPPSLIIGETITAELTSDRDFFKKDLEEPIVSDGGLVLESWSVVDDRHAIAELTAENVQTTGNHRFEIERKGRLAWFEISVFEPESGPGEITSVSGNVATNGADRVSLYVSGYGTHFDSFMKTKVQGAPGVIVNFVEVISSGYLRINYSVALTQEPAAAAFVLSDPPFTYEVPLSIVSATKLKSLGGPQPIVPGRLTIVKVEHPDSGMTYDSMVVVPYSDEFLVARPKFIETGKLEIPVVWRGRDELQEPLELEVQTRTEGGAFLERMTVELEPVALGRLETDNWVVPVADDQSMEFRCVEFDCAKIQNVTVSDDGPMALTGWSTLEDRLLIDFDISPLGVQRAPVLKVSTSNHDYELPIAVNESNAPHFLASRMRIVAGETKEFVFATRRDVGLFDPVVTAERGLEVGEVKFLGRWAWSVEVTAAPNAEADFYGLFVEFEKEQRFSVQVEEFDWGM